MTAPLRARACGWRGCRLLPALAAALVLCSGCSISTPAIQHLQLSSGVSQGGTGDAPVILIEAIELPDYLLRDELARRVDDVTLRYDPYIRWSEPLDLAVQRVLAEHLGALLDTRRVARFPNAPRGGADWLLQVTVRRFERESSRVVLRAEATWARAENSSRTVHSVSIDESKALAADASGADAARALSELLERLADALAIAFQSSD